MYRSSTGDLSFHEDPPARGGGGQRWDRDRFERMRGSGGSSGGGSVRGDEHEHYRFQERDRLPGGGRRDIDIHEDVNRRPTRVVEREVFHENDHFDRPMRRRPNEIFEERAEVANLALAPYRRKSVVEKDIDISVRRPQRPGYIRRQSSLDTFDRRPVPRYGELERIDRIDIRDRERDEWRPPVNKPIPLPVRERRRSAERRRFREDDFEEELRYRDVERERDHDRGRGREEEEYREVEIRREKSKRRRSRSRAAKSIAATSVRSSSASSFEEVKTISGRKGKTRMPKRLVKKQAVIDLGYPFEEEEDFIIVKRALEKDHIDEIIKISENYKEVEKTTYVYEDKPEVIHAPPPPPPPPMFMAPPPPPPPPATIIHEHHSVAAPSVRGASPSRHTVYEERIEESNHIGGPLTVLVPEERRTVFRDTHESRELVIPEGRHLTRSERDIKDEIRRLEDERRMLKYERESDYEFIERREPRREVVRVEKDRKARPNPKLVAAMLATLS